MRVAWKTPYDAADEAFHRLQESFFDWNEVRATTVTELVEHMGKLPDANAAAVRVKKNLQSLFETRYSFELDDLIKMNQGKAVAELEKLAGMSRFVLAYVTQNALGGHAIPVSKGIMKVLLATEIVSDAEAAKDQTPGLERTVPKAKGPEFSSCLHQLGLLLAKAPGGKNAKAILKEAGAAEPGKPPKSKLKSSQDKKSAPSKAAAQASPPKPPVAKKAVPAKKPAPKPAGKKSSGKKLPLKSTALKRKPR